MENPDSTSKLGPSAKNVPSVQFKVEKLGSSVWEEPRIEHWPVDKLTPHPSNTEIYGEEDKSDELAMATAMDYGQIVPITIKADGTILSGHQRHRAAQKNNFKTVSVQVRKFASAEDELEFLIMSNTQRKKTPLQKSMEAYTLMEVEKKKAKERQIEGGKGKDKLPEAAQSRDKVGKRLGIAGRTVDKMVAIVETIRSLDVDGREEVKKMLVKSVNAAWGTKAVKAYVDAKKKNRGDTDEEAEESDNFTLDEWNLMSKAEQEDVLALSALGKKTMNPQSSTSIEWAMQSWNPVTGCECGCNYCYARNMIDRYKLYTFQPNFHPRRLNAPIRTKVPEMAKTDARYKNVFVCSMADLFGDWVPLEWINAVLAVVRSQPQWNFLFLTKYPHNLAQHDWPLNAFVGASIDRQNLISDTMAAFEEMKVKHPGVIRWLSLEPLLTPMNFASLAMFDFIVIGGASKMGITPDFVPEEEWITPLIARASTDGCKIYLKDNTEYRPVNVPGVKKVAIKKAPKKFLIRRKETVADRKEEREKLSTTLSP